MLDEIFAVGDAGFRVKCEARFRELHKAGHTVVLVTHDPRAVRDFCDRVILIDEGAILLDGAPNDAAQRYLSTLVATA